MKKINFLLGAAASMMLALTMTSCSNEDNPVTKDDVQEMAEQHKYPGNLIIKEINVGGCKNDNNQAYNWCRGMVLYNNGATTVTVKNLALGFAYPQNSQASNYNYGEDGKLIYEGEDFLPVGQAIWYLPETIEVAPYSDVVLAINGAIDHVNNPTNPSDAKVSQAFDLSNADIAMYDPESQFVSPYAYPAPAGSPRLMKAVSVGLGNAWSLSMMSGAFVLFAIPEDVNIEDLAAEDNIWYSRNFNGENTAQSNACIKIQKDWVLDGVELFRSTQIDWSAKRLPASIDAGYGLYNDTFGYSAYRNVDQEATEGLYKNADKLVYDYDQEVLGTKDNSGIDAAASIKNGARVIYKDTNNSTADFHVRATWSLK